MKRRPPKIKNPATTGKFEQKSLGMPVFARVSIIQNGFGRGVL
jgi:hypothetical protein